MLRGVLTAMTSSEKSRASKLHSPSLVKRSPTISRPASHVADDPRSICKHNKCLTYRTVGFDDAPAYQQDNPFIRTGYRANFAVSTCLVSLFRLHNQTCNVWSHLLGVPIFLALALYTYLFIAPEDNFSGTTLMFFLFLASAIVSMLTSSCYHLFQCHSEGAWLRLLQVDLSGMSALIAGSCYPSLWIVFGNGCHGQTAVVYITAISFICSVGILGPLWPPFNTPRYRRARVIIYSGMGLSSLVPLFHIPFVFPAAIAWPILADVGLSLLFFAVGVWFYASKFPEARWPGKFDVWFHSHTNWHTVPFILEPFAG